MSSRPACYKYTIVQYTPIIGEKAGVAPEVIHPGLKTHGKSKTEGASGLTKWDLDPTKQLLTKLHVKFVFVFQINYNHFTGKFRLCQQFFNGQACKIGEPFCTFAHSEAEAELWLLELNGMLDLTAFVHDQCRFRLQSKFCN